MRREIQIDNPEFSVFVTATNVRAKNEFDLTRYNDGKPPRPYFEGGSASTNYRFVINDGSRLALSFYDFSSCGKPVGMVFAYALDPETPDEMLGDFMDATMSNETDEVAAETEEEFFEFEDKWTVSSGLKVA